MIRPATAADLEAEHAVFDAAMAELRSRRGAPWTPRAWEPEGRWATVHHHLLAHDGGRAAVAEEGGEVVGFAAAWVRSDVWFLAALFVHPAHQGRGAGRALLDAVWDGEHPRRATVTEAIQPVSNALYAGRGLIPATPVLELEGTPAATAPQELEPAVADAAALAAIDAAAYGFDRAADHGVWARTSATARMWTRAGRPVAYAYARPGGIGPVAALTPADAAGALRAELARCDGPTSLSIPGSAAEMVAVAVAAGLRMGDPGLLLLSPPQRPPEAVALHSYWLM
jgi:GNAT superfamily N-acetyltransferase